MPSNIILTHPTAGPSAAPIALDLPQDLLWTDEFAWKKVEQSLEYSTTGALVVDEWTKQAGRPITLAGTVERGWCKRDTLKTLNTWAGQTGLTLSLMHNGVAYSVMWDHSAGPITAEPIVEYREPEDTDFYSLTLYFVHLG